VTFVVFVFSSDEFERTSINDRVGAFHSSHEYQATNLKLDPPDVLVPFPHVFLHVMVELV